MQRESGNRFFELVEHWTKPRDAQLVPRSHSERSGDHLGGVVCQRMQIIDGSQRFGDRGQEAFAGVSEFHSARGPFK